MKKKARKQPKQRATLEISRAQLSLVVREVVGEVQRIRGEHVAWLKQATSLNSDEGMAELTAALTELVAKEKLNNATVNVALSSDFCVTRVVAGETDRVQLELRALRERSNQYLMLGNGRKAVSESNSAIDAKQTQAWLTVTDEILLDHVVKAVSQAGLQIGLIEHDIVAICRAVGRMGRDQESPVIIAEMNHQGVDLGICYNGQLLFDYRPGGVDCRGRIAEIVQRHLERIQRYCNRQFSFATGEINNVLICAPGAEAEEIRQQFNLANGLSAEVLNPQEVCPDWECDESIGTDPRFLPAIGTALVDDDSLRAAASGRGVPNLMDFFLSANRAPLWPTFLRAAWPIAAVILLAAGVFAMASWKHGEASALEKQMVEREAQLAMIRNTTMETQSATTELEYLQRIAGGLMNPDWQQFLRMIGGSMPTGVWLDSLRVEQEGDVSITGPGASEDLIFDFVRYLKRVPGLVNVNLEGQQPIRLRQGPAIRFDVKCKFTGQQNLAERTVRND